MYYDIISLRLYSNSNLSIILHSSVCHERVNDDRYLIIRVDFGRLAALIDVDKGSNTRWHDDVVAVTLDTTQYLSRIEQRSGHRARKRRQPG